jgi:hypothetical protein
VRIGRLLWGNMRECSILYAWLQNHCVLDGLEP